MKLIDRVLLTALVRRHPDIADGELDLPQALAAARAASGVTRRDVAQRVGVSVADVLAFDLGVSDPPLSGVRRYAHASGVFVTHEVETEES